MNDEQRASSVSPREPAGEEAHPRARYTAGRFVAVVFLAAAACVIGLGLLHFFLLGALSPWPCWDTPQSMARYAHRTWLMQAICPSIMACVVAAGLFVAAVRLGSLGLGALGVWTVVNFVLGDVELAVMHERLRPAWGLLGNGRYLAESLLGAMATLGDMLLLLGAVYLVARDIALRAAQSAS